MKYLIVYSRDGDTHRPSIMREARHLQARMMNYFQDMLAEEVQVQVYRTFSGMKAIDLTV